MDAIYSPKIQKQNSTLSQLAKGVGDIAIINQQEKRLEILLDESDILSENSTNSSKMLDSSLHNRSKTSIGLTNNTTIISNINNNISNNLRTEINLPKTFTTKKGALLLFSEDILPNKKEKNSHLSERSNTEDDLGHAQKEKRKFESQSFSEMPMRTVNDLQRNILFYGVPKEELTSLKKPSTLKIPAPLKELTNENIFNEIQNPTENFSLISTRNLIQTNANSKNNNESTDTKVKKVNRGYSARRYVRNLTKNWDQNLLDTFISDGKLNPATVYGNMNSDNSEANLNASKKRRISDDLTVWPQAYKFDESWIAATVDMRSYKFLKAQDFNLNKPFQEEKIDKTGTKRTVKNAEENKQTDTIISVAPTLPMPQTKVNIINPDPIKIFDQRSNEVSYKSLNMSEKERVLSELLFNSALKNISKNRIGYFNYNYNEYDDLDEISEDKLNSTTDENKLMMTSQVFPITKDQTTLDDKKIPLLAETSNLAEKSLKNPSNLSPNSKLNTSKQSSNMQPIYMFGKSSGAPWIKPNKTIFEIINPKQPISQAQAQFEASKLKLGTYTPQLPAEKSFSNQTNTPSEMFRNMPSKSFIRKQIAGHSASRGGSSRGLDSKVSNNLYVSSARGKELNEEQILKNAVNKNSSDLKSNQNEFQSKNEMLNQVIDLETLVIKNDFENDLDRHYSTGHIIEADENLTPAHIYSLDEVRSQKSAFTLESNFDDTKNLKAPFKRIDENEETIDKENLLENTLSQQLDVENNLADFSSTSLESPNKMINSETRKKMNRKKDKEGIRKKAKKESKTEEAMKKLALQRVEFETLKSEVTKAPTLSNPFDVMKPFEKHKQNKNIELTFSESKEKLYNVGKIVKDDGQEVKRVISPNESFDMTKKKHSSKSTPANTLNEAPILREKITREKLKRTTKPYLSDGGSEVGSSTNLFPEVASDNKISLPKLGKGKQNVNESVNNKNVNNTSTSKEIPEEKEKSGMSMFGFDDSYAQVSKLKPKVDANEKFQIKKPNIPLAQSNGVDLKLNFLKNTNEPIKSLNEPRAETRWGDTKKNENQNVNLNVYQGASQISAQATVKFNNFTAMGIKDADVPMRQDTFTLKSKENQSTQQPPVSFNNFGLSGPKDNDGLLRQDTFLPKSKANPTPSTQKRTINWDSGDFDPRECFVMWSYEPPPPPIVVDKKFADSLKRYAELMAKLVLGKGGGKNLSEDVRRALRENLAKLRDAIARGEVGKEVLEEYKKVFKNMLSKVFGNKNLENLEIDDDMLMKLLELPPDAFEIYTDPITGKEKLRVKSSYLREQAKIVREVVTEKILSMDDFDVEIDPVTGEKKLKLKADVAKKLGIPDGAEDMIEIYTDEFGNQVMRLKNGAKTITIGDTTYELVIDPETGQTVLKMTTKQKVGKETIEDIMRLAANMTPETRHRYFQELLKTSGDKLSEELRRQIVNEMISNANNLPPELRENLLKDLVKDLINVLPPEYAKKLLDDIMKATDNLDVNLKEQMIKNLMANLDDLPPDIKESTLKSLIKNIDNLSAEAKAALLQDILTKVEEMGVSLDGNSEFKDLRNEILKEMIKNSQNLDEETRAKILQQVMEKLAAEGDGEIPAVVLAELVKQMNSMPESIRNKVMEEIHKNLEKGELDSSVLAALLANPNELTPEMLAAIVKNSDKMDADTLKELVKNLDKLPDDLKQEMINKMVNNLKTMDTSVQQQLLKELLTNPELIQDEVLREKVMRDIMGKMTAEDIDRETAGMTAEEKNIYLQNLLKRAGNLSDETRQKIIAELLKNAENLDEETRENLLRNLMENVVKDLPPELAQKVLAEIMKNTENLDASLKQKMIESLLNNMDFLPPELRQQTLQEIIKNLDDLSAEKKEEIFKSILQNIDSLPQELRDQALKTIINNMDNLSSDAKNKLLQEILDKVESGGDDSEFSKQLRQEVLKEIIKNSQNLDETERAKILKDVMEKLAAGGDVPDEVLSELLKQMDKLPDEVKKAVLEEMKKNLEKGKISADQLDDLFKKAGGMPLELLEKVVDNINKMEPDALKKLVKNLDAMPDNLKTKAIQEMLKNIENLDPSVQRELLKEILKNPALIKDQKVLDKAIMDLVSNLEKLPEDLRKDMLKDIAKNINNLSKEVKEKVMKEVFNNLKGSSDETREEVLKQLLKKMGKEELEEWIKNSDLSDEMKAKMLSQITKLIESGDVYLDSDDEDELEGLTGEERARRRRQLIEKKKDQMGNIFTSESTSQRPKEVKRDLSWLKLKKEKVLGALKKDPNDSSVLLNEEQIDFLKAFNKLTDYEKAKLLETLTEEERQNLIQLRDEFEKLRQKELQDALIEARNLAIHQLRESLARQRRLDYLNFLRFEWSMFEHDQQLSRAFVFSYFEMLQGLEVQSILDVI